MKHRNDGGYSLALVLVVMAVLATIVTVLLTVTIDNMRVQEKQIERMQDQYEAQGKLEKVLANLSQNQVVELSGSMELSSTDFSAALTRVVQKVCAGTGVEMADEPGDYNFEFTDEDLTGVLYEQPFMFEFKLSAESGAVTVTYEMTLEGDIAHSAAPESGVSLFNYMYLITNPVITHRSVDVSGVMDEGG